MTLQNSHDYTPEINLESSTLLPAEKTKLLDLLTEYSDIFATSGTPATQSQVVKHNNYQDHWTPYQTTTS